ncbi:MAG: hypothetical protein P4L50_24150 [Anaerolineaceae bacterium]|nr:hypothetical protein [Anaerolineaceae bacterium]
MRHFLAKGHGARAIQSYDRITLLHQRRKHASIVFQILQGPLLQQRTMTSVVIDKVELAYFAYDFSHGGGSDLDTSPQRFVQPVWRFSGKLNDGRSVEVLVQAVVDDYLK